MQDYKRESTKKYVLAIKNGCLTIYDIEAITFGSMFAGSSCQYCFYKKNGYLIEEISTYDEVEDFWDTYTRNVGKILFESNKPIEIKKEE